MIRIFAADKKHIPIIRDLADKIWPQTFSSILSPSQIEYMMEMMYSSASIVKQIEDGHQFAVAREDEINVGYVSYEVDCNQSRKTKIHKLYVSPQHQHCGIGKAMVEYVAQNALKTGNNAVFLNVNKHNTQAINFYSKLQFILVKKEEIDIGNGFIMDDFVFELKLVKNEQ